MSTEIFTRVFLHGFKLFIHYGVKKIKNQICLRQAQSYMHRLLLIFDHTKSWLAVRPSAPLTLNIRLSGQIIKTSHRLKFLLDDWERGCGGSEKENESSLSKRITLWCLFSTLILTKQTCLRLFFPVSVFPLSVRWPHMGSQLISVDIKDR